MYSNCWTNLGIEAIVPTARAIQYTSGSKARNTGHAVIWMGTWYFASGHGSNSWLRGASIVGRALHYQIQLLLMFKLLFHYPTSIE